MANNDVPVSDTNTAARKDQATQTAKKDMANQNDISLTGEKPFPPGDEKKSALKDKKPSIILPKKNAPTITEEIRKAGYKNSKIIKEAEDPFLHELNKKAILAVLRENAPWMLQDPRPLYTQNPMNNSVWRDANQTMLLLANSLSQRPYINYAPVYICSDKGWLENISKQQKEAAWANICYTGKNPQTGDKTYQLTCPTKPLNQNIIQENPATQPPIPGIGPMPSPNASDSNASIQNLLNQQLGQRFNAGFTKEPFNPVVWDKDMMQALITSIQQNPVFMNNVSKKAFDLSLENRLADKNTITVDKKEITALIEKKEPSFMNHFYDTLSNHVINVYTKKETYTDHSMPVVNQIIAKNNTIDKKSITNDIKSLMQHPAIQNIFINSYIDIKTNNYRDMPNEQHKNRNNAKGHSR
jgi:hypothetical protein